MCKVKRNPTHSRGERPKGCGFAALHLQASLKETYCHGLIEMVCQRHHHLQPSCTLFVSVQEWQVHTLPFLPSDFILVKEANLCVCVLCVMCISAGLKKH